MTPVDQMAANLAKKGILPEFLVAGPTIIQAMLDSPDYHTLVDEPYTRLQTGTEPIFHLKVVPVGDDKTSTCVVTGGMAYPHI